jgi:hypothetical protein
MASILGTGDGYDPFEPAGAPSGPPAANTTPQEAPLLERSKELQLFMMSVRRQSSGSFTGNYHANGGAYGIDASRWDAMARRAGLDGANQQDPGMQDYVAAWTMKALYSKYRNWNLVALAWNSGSGAAAEVVLSTRKAPESVTLADISDFGYSTYTSGVMANMSKLGYKGVTQESDLTLEQAVNRPTQVITGTGNVSVEDTYNATARALWDEAKDQDAKAMPSAAETLFSQIDQWSQSVAGGARRDFRTDVSAVQAERGIGNSESKGQELAPMTIEERE